MKELKRIRLINWHLFENTTITCQGTTYFIGTNGTGKSVLVQREMENCPFPIRH